MAEPDLDKWLRALFAAHQNRTDAMQAAWQQLRDNGFVSKVTVHTYRCPRCSGPLVIVVRLSGNTIAYVKDYKQSPGMNREKSVPAARKKNTIDGDRHWPSHAYDVDELVEWGPQAGFAVACRHISTTVRAVDVLAITDGIRPGHPGAPTVL